METIVKARKIHQCDCCQGNIQKGEKHIHAKHRDPLYDENENQTGIQYYEFRLHNKDCTPRLIGWENQKEIIKNCNFGIHKPNCFFDPDEADEHCEYCGIVIE